MLKLAKALVKAAWRRFRYRSSVTGRYVSKEEAERNPAETVRERAK